MDVSVPYRNYYVCKILVEDSGEFIVHTVDIIIDIVNYSNLTVAIGEPRCIQKDYFTSDMPLGPSLLLMNNSVSFYNHVTNSTEIRTLRKPNL